MTNKIQRIYNETINNHRDKNSFNDYENRLIDILKEVKKVKGFYLNKKQIEAILSFKNKRILEMKTGEGKTVVAGVYAILLAQEGKNVHIITANDYLAERDSKDIGEIAQKFGVSVSFNNHHKNIDEKNTIYSSNIIYGTVSSFAFDYLNNNLIKEHSDHVKICYDTVIIDEADSILLDEALTPMIISKDKQAKLPSYDILKNLYNSVSELEGQEKLIGNILSEWMFNQGKYTDFIYDVNNNSAFITERGYNKIKRNTNIDFNKPENIHLLHFVNQLLIADKLKEIGIDYIVENDEVILIDENTGRKLIGRRFADGLHEAIEVKEGIEPTVSSRTQAKISVVNFIQLYSDVTGLTGTAWTERKNLLVVYGFSVKKIETEKAIKRIDHDVQIFNKKYEKINYILKKVKTEKETGRPILIGTRSVIDSIVISTYLKEHGINHEVLNAVDDYKESIIISNAGRLNSVTIATNMAGRGTDIKLGGDPERIFNNYLENEIITDMNIKRENITDDLINAYKYKNQDMFLNIKEHCDWEKKQVIQRGGLLVIGYESHHVARVDNQLRGRAGRQGEIGESVFLISLEDELPQLYGKKKLTPHQVRKMQKDIEQQNLDMLKSNTDFDRVDFVITKSFYKERLNILAMNDQELMNHIEKEFSIEEKEKDTLVNNLKLFKKFVDGQHLVNLVVQLLDDKWIDFLTFSENTRNVVSLYQYGTKDKKVSYKYMLVDEYNRMFDNVFVEAVKAIIKPNITEEFLREVVKI